MQSFLTININPNIVGGTPFFHASFAVCLHRNDERP